MDGWPAVVIVVACLTFSLFVIILFDRHASNSDSDNGSYDEFGGHLTDDWRTPVGFRPPPGRHISPLPDDSEEEDLPDYQ